MHAIMLNKIPWNCCEIVLFKSEHFMDASLHILYIAVVRKALPLKN